MDVFANAKYESIITQWANFREIVHFTIMYSLCNCKVVSTYKQYFSQSMIHMQACSFSKCNY